MNRVYIKTYCQMNIKTYGCQMNERDSEAVAAMLRARGYRIVADEDECDILLLNTCSVRDAAEQKAIGKAATCLRSASATRTSSSASSAAWRRTAAPSCSTGCPTST
jgi:tRNA A37 methylthiotransferase MiaB